VNPELIAWVASDDHQVEGWAPEPSLDELQCHPDLVERLAEIARPLRFGVRVFVAGCPVLHHPGGSPIACASGTRVLLVRSGQPAGALVSDWAVPHELDASWVSLDPWATDVTFTRTVGLLREHMRRAYDHAEAGAWR
jgi:hypothetical protein